MNKEIIITVVGVQRDEAGEETRIAMQVPGEFYDKNGTLFLFYEEKDPETGAITENSLKYVDGTLTHTRKGNVEARMVFTPGVNCLTAYKSPFGLLHLEIRTKSLTCLMSDKKGTVRVSYDLYADDAFVSSNELTLQIKSR